MQLRKSLLASFACSMLILTATSAFAQAEIGIAPDTQKGFQVFQSKPAPRQALSASTIQITLASGLKKQLNDAMLTYDWVLNSESTEACINNVVITDTKTSKDFTMNGGKNAITSFAVPKINACFGLDVTNFPRAMARLLLADKTIAEIKVSASGKLDTNGSTTCSKALVINEKTCFSVKSDALKGATFYKLMLTTE